MEEEIKSDFSDINIRLVEGDGGIFEILCNGTVLFSRKTLVGTHTKRFPTKGEVSLLIQEVSKS